MLVDRGLGFGGSLIVAARLARSLKDTTCFEPILISPMDADIVKHHTGEGINTYKITQPIDYIVRGKVSKILEKIRPRLLRKLVSYTATIFIEIVNLKYLFALAIIIIKENIDVVHINQPYAPILAALLTRRHSLLHLHGGTDKPMSKVQTFWLALPKRVVSISEHTKNCVVGAGMDGGRITVIPNPTSPTRFSYSADTLHDLRTQYKLHDKCVVSIFGRLIPWKGQLQLLQAISLIYRPGLNIHILIVGDDEEGYGDYRTQLEKYVIDHNLGSIVSFTGYQNDVDKYYQVTDIAAHCSIEPEPFGLVITEAMQNKCVVIASSLGAGGEIITDQVDGLVVDPLNDNALGEALLKLIENKSLRDLYSVRAKDTSDKKYDSTTIARAFAAEYEMILSRK